MAPLADEEIDRTVRAARGEPCLGAGPLEWVDEYDDRGPPRPSAATTAAAFFSVGAASAFAVWIVVAWFTLP